MVFRPYGFHAILICLSLLATVLAQPLFAQVTLHDMDLPVVEPELQAEFRRAYRLQIDGSQQDSVLLLHLTSFSNLDSSLVKQRWTIDGRPAVTDQSIALPVKPSYLIEVEGQATEAGQYTGSIAWQLGDIQEMRRLRFTHLTTRPQLELIGPETAMSSTTRWTLFDSLGLPTRTVRPTLASLYYVTDENKQIQAPFNQVTFTDEAGHPLSDSILFSAIQPTAFYMKIKGLSHSGEYLGTLRITGSGIKTIDREFTLLLKNPWYVAAFFIFIGVAVSYLIRRYYQTSRPRALQEIAIREQIESLNRVVGRLGALRNEEKELVAILQQDYEAQLRKVGGDATQLTAALSNINERLAILPVWINVRRAAAQLQPEVSKDLEQELVAIEAYLKGLAPKKEEDDFAQQLLILKNKIAERVKAELVAKIEKFKSEVDEAMRQAPSGAADTQLLQSISDRLTQASQMAEQDQLAQAKSTFNECRKDFVDHAINTLKRSLADAAPLGVSDVEWQQLLREADQLLSTAANLDSEAKYAAYQQAARQYYQVVLTGLSRHVSEQIEIVEKLDQEKEQNQRLLEELRKLQQEIQQTLLEKDLQHLAANSKRLAADMEQMDETIEKHQPKSRSIRDIAMPRSMPSEYTHVPEQEAMPNDSVSEDNLSLLTGARKWVVTGDAKFSFILLLVAVVLGIQLLWVDDTTWGDAKDYIIALLWGLGLHQVGDMSSNITSIEQRIKAEPEQEQL